MSEILYSSRLQRIVDDVSTGVNATAEVNSDKVLYDFEADLNHIIERERKKYSPKGLYSKVMTVIVGYSFNYLPLEQRFMTVSRIAKLSDAEKQDMMTETLQKLQSDYQQAPPTYKQEELARVYARACNYFSVRHDQQGNLKSSFPDWKNQDKTNITLPTLIHPHPEARASLPTTQNIIYNNNRLQENIAKATGVFSPDETSWSEFARNKVKLVDNTYQLTPEDTALRVGRVKHKSTKDLTTGVSLVVFGKLPTKYPETTAILALNYFPRGKLRGNIGLDGLLEEGVLATRLSIRIPTRILLLTA